jgi:type II secretory pathway component PulC
MIRGLLMRQIFMISEGILWVAILAIGGMALMDMYKPSVSRTQPASTGDDTITEISLNNPVGDRSNYDGILNKGLFGAAGKYEHNAKPNKPKPPPPPPPPKNVEDSKLPLELKGTVALGEENPFSSAVIDVKEKGIGVRAFFIGEAVIDNVFLIKVNDGEVLLDNKRANRQEKLKHVLDTGKNDKPKGPALAGNAPRVAASRPPSPRERPSGQQLVSLKREEITQKLQDDYERLASTVDVKESLDENGNLQGLTADNIESIDSLRDLGFQNGDVLVSINNEKVQSQSQITALANKYQNATIVRVGIIRAGSPMNFTYRVH